MTLNMIINVVIFNIIYNTKTPFYERYIIIDYILKHCVALYRYLILEGPRLTREKSNYQSMSTKLYCRLQKHVIT